MRKTFLEGCKSAKEAKRRASWASKVTKVENGYLAFESVDEYYRWRGQK